MRKSIVVLIAAVLLIAAGVAAWMWSSPLLDEEAEYEVTSLYRYGQNITGQVVGDDVVDLLREESRSTLPRGGLAAHAYTELIEINLMSGEENSAESIIKAIAFTHLWKDCTEKGTHRARCEECKINTVKKTSVLFLYP